MNGTMTVCDRDGTVTGMAATATGPQTLQITAPGAATVISHDRSVTMTVTVP